LSSQVTFIYIALFTIQIVSKQLYSELFVFIPSVLFTTGRFLLIGYIVLQCS